MSATSERYEEAARQWDERGRPVPEPDGWAAMITSCWMHSAGGKHAGASDRLKDYVAALQKAAERRNPNWLDDLFDDREYCSYCGLSWRAENCRYCTSCSRAYPPCCEDKRGLTYLSNGNYECGACHKGELVG